MRGRTSRISATIVHAILDAKDAETSRKKPSTCVRLTRYVLNFFNIWHLDLVLYRNDDFFTLRRDVWQLNNGAYTRSFQVANDENIGQHAPRLISMGDLGYSGSTFFKTLDGQFLIKSLDRHFEYHFFMHELLTPYIIHMREHPGSLMVRITNLLYVPYATLGGMLGTEPTHHVVMENLLYGIGDDGDATCCETFDLKPDDYFFPERDIANGSFAPQSVKNKLVDHFPDNVRISRQATEELLALLDTDTKFLADLNVLDYSLFLVRYPRTEESAYVGSIRPAAQSSSAATPADSWRTGIVSRDNQWVYRAILLDFFWARHRFHAKAMSSLVGIFNIWAGQGPMTITTEPFEYRKRFMSMVQKLLEGNESSGGYDLEQSAVC